jgi:hypothetical protein
MGSPASSSAPLSSVASGHVETVEQTLLEALGDQQVGFVVDPHQTLAGRGE